MLFAPKQQGQSLIEFAIVLTVLGIIFYVVINAVAPDKVRAIKAKF